MQYAFKFFLVLALAGFTVARADNNLSPTPPSQEQVNTADDHANADDEENMQLEPGADVELKDGTNVSKLETVGVLSILRRMQNHHNGTFQDVVMKAHGLDIKLEPRVIKKLSIFGLLDEEGEFAPNAQDIIVNFTKIQDGKARLTYPFGGGNKWRNKHNPQQRVYWYRQ
ncbi:MAG: hypothetical protein Q8K75_03970 [Chlamydiales bacterium]|nr:hypothetical protein [Chlamydiales bacterium]